MKECIILGQLTEEKVNEQKPAEEVIMPFEYREDEHYYIESLGKIKRKPFLFALSQLP